MDSMNDDSTSLPALPPGFKYMACKHCSKPMKVGNKRRNSPSHTECGIGIAIEVQRQMANKSGPYYERWLNSQANALKRARGGGASES